MLITASTRRRQLWLWGLAMWVEFLWVALPELITVAKHLVG